MGISVNTLNSLYGNSILSEVKKVMRDASHTLFANYMFLPTVKRLINVHCQRSSKFKNLVVPSSILCTTIYPEASDDVCFFNSMHITNENMPSIYNGVCTLHKYSVV